MAGAVVLAEGERMRIVRWLNQEADYEDLLVDRLGNLSTLRIRQHIAAQMRQYSAACRLIARRLEDED